MSKTPAWPWLQKPTHRPPGHLNLGYYQGRDTGRAVLFGYHGHQVWIPRKALVWHSGHFMAPRWAVENSLKFQQNRGQSPMTTDKPILTFGTLVLYRDPFDQEAVLMKITRTGTEDSISATWLVEAGEGADRRRNWLNHREVSEGARAYMAKNGQAEGQNDDTDDGHLDRFMCWNERARLGHAKNVAAGWWTAIKDLPATPAGADLHGIRNVGELLMLCTSEVAEAAEGVAGNLMDDKLPHRPMIEVELADTKIRVFDLAGATECDLDGARGRLIHAGEIPNVKQEGSIEKCLLQIVRQFSAAMEGHRKNAEDRFIGGRKAFEVRLAAALMWIDATAEVYGYDVEGAIIEKEAFNAQRADHKIENRKAVGGKAY